MVIRNMDGRSGRRAHRMHWLIIALSLGVTLSAWWFTSRQVDERAETRFAREADAALALITEQIRTYEDGLWGGVAAIQASGGDMTHPEWLIFAETLRIEEKYPGINGIGVIHRVAPGELDDYLADQQRFRPDYAIHPPHDEPEFMPITFIEPAGPNAKAVGLDMAHETNRYQGMQRARDTGEAQITGPIVLVQDAGETPGFLFFAPWYERAGVAPDSVAARRDHFVGVVYAPFVMQTLMAGAVADERQHITLTIRDGEEVLYDENLPAFADFDASPMLTQTETVDMFGREWTFEIHSGLSFRPLVASNEPLFVLIGGLALDGLLIALFAILQRSNSRAVRYADDVTAQLRGRTRELESSYAELERFAYAASHDLKTPLRGVSHLIEFMDEDLEDSPHHDVVVPYLDRMRAQLARMNALITGLLDYARLDARPVGGVGELNVGALVDRLRQDLGVSAAEVTYRGPATVTAVEPIHLQQVVANLVSNAVQHHHRPDARRVEVVVVVGVTELVLEVHDNGPGIAHEYQDQIFDVFATLGTETGGTGIGLSMVRKMVAKAGGSVAVSSSEGAGSHFTVRWPVAPTSSEVLGHETTAGLFEQGVPEAASEAVDHFDPVGSSK